MSESTAVALTAPTDQEIEQVRRRGAAMVAHRQELAKLDKQIAGMTWGSGTQAVRGASFSPMMRAVFAEFCLLTRANPMYHVDIVGDKPYLNSNYWSDLINSRPDFHHHDQRDLSPSVEKALRERAARHRQAANELSAAGMTAEAAERIRRALDFEDEADDVAMARAQWSAPEWATVVVQTSIHKFIDAAPLDRIRRGEIIDLDRYIVVVHECNWAGGKPPTRRKRSKEKGGGEYEYESDPIGNADPAKTARTRSLRRAAVKSFPAWMQQYEEQIRKAEEAIEAEWREIRSDRASDRAQLPAPTGVQAVATGNGEPSAARAEGARELPTREVKGEMRVLEETGVRTVTKPFVEPAQGAADDRLPDLRKQYFATLRDAGIANGDRKAFQERLRMPDGSALPESTSEWNADHLELAIAELRWPAIKKLREGAAIIGADVDLLARDRFDGRKLDELYLREINALIEHVAVLVSEMDADEGGQGRLV